MGENYSIFVFGGDDSVKDGKIDDAKAKLLSRARVEGCALGKRQEYSSTVEGGKAEERVQMQVAW